MVSIKHMIEYTAFVIHNDVPENQLMKIFKDKNIDINQQYMDLVLTLQDDYRKISEIYKHNSAKINQFMQATKESAVANKVEKFIGFPPVFADFYANFVKAINFDKQDFKYIEGPISFMYLKGDPGDGIIRKILLLGDYHLPGIRCTSTETISVANFCRYVAARTSTIIDVFIESFFEDPLVGYKIPEEEKEGKYLANLQFEFRHCLRSDKSLCDEPLRVHYIDPRYIIKNQDVFSLFLIEQFVEGVLHPTNIFNRGIWDQVRWPEGQEIERMARVTIEDARLGDNKLLSIDPSIRQNFKDMVLAPIIQRINAFYRDASNRDLFEQIRFIRQQALTTRQPIDDDTPMEDFKLRLIMLKASLLDAYFVYRLLKRATKRRPQLPKVALKQGEPTTHVIGYTGAFHTFGIRDMLYRLGFEILAKEDNNNIELAGKSEEKRLQKDIDQCLPYNSIRKSVDDFCKKEFD